MTDDKQHRSSQQDQDGDALISRQAAEWFARLLDEQAPQQDYHAFRDWLQADERHARAYAEFDRLWASAATAPTASVSRRTALKTGGALAVAGLSGWGFYRFNQHADHQTGVGERRLVDLKDGSQIELSAASAISLRYTAKERRIVLSDGEIFCRVAVDRQRPFVVEAGALTATALGTQYSVARLGRTVGVTVTEHSVAVEASGHHVEVFAGEAVDLRDGTLSGIQKDDNSARLSWRDGPLVFISKPFGEVVATLNRWRPGRLIVADTALARQNVTIIINIRSPAEIDRALVQGLPVRIANYTPWLTWISPR
jgi:transmembrane sensor